MTTKTRLQKMEAQTELDRPCYLWGKCQAVADAIGNYLRRHGIKLPPPRLVTYDCFDCGCPRLFSTDDLDDAAIAECISFYDELKHAHREGLEVSEDAVRRCKEYAEQGDEYLRATLGEHYESAMQAGKDAEEQYTADYVQRYMRPVRVRGNRR